MDHEPSGSTREPTAKKERNFPALDLKDQSTLSTDTQPVLVVQSPKTPTLSRKLKAVSLDSEPQPQGNTLEVSRDVFSMPNTPKKQIKQKLSCDFDDGHPKGTLAPGNSNLKKFASNNSISGSQTLKTLPEINALQDFSDCPNPEPQKVRTKGLLERRGSNASLTIDLGSTQNLSEVKAVPLHRLNNAKSVSNLNLGSLAEKCSCVRKTVDVVTKTSASERRKSQETCGNCTIYESEAKLSTCKARCQNLKRCHCCTKSRRKSLSNENLYVPPCGFCEGENKDLSEFKNGKGNNCKAVFPRQHDLDSTQLLSDDFKLQMQNMHYLLTAGKVMSVEDLQQSCEATRIPKLQQEFWEVPLNLQEKCYVSGSQSKNRYRGVLPNEHSRVHLPSSGGYIHANYIKGPDYTETSYIATQGPLSHTCTDFWEMVWHSQCKCIVMLTALVEKGNNKCELYFPLGKKSDTEEKTFLYVKTSKVRDKFTFDTHSNTNTYETETFEFEEKNVVTFGKYRVTYVGETSLDECQIRHLELRKTDLNVEPRILHHYWLPNWPDHKKTNAEQVMKVAVDVLRCLDTNRVDISTESLRTCSKQKEPKLDTHQADLREVGSSEVPTPSQNASDFFQFSHKHAKRTSKNKFSFDLTSSDSCIETTVTSSDTFQVTGPRTFTFSVNSSSSSNASQQLTSSSSSRSSSSKFNFGEANVLKFDFQNESKTPVTHSKSDSEAYCSDQVRQKSIESSSKSSSREGSISDFNKETLQNRCSLDSKLQNLNKLPDLRNQFKREVYIGALKSKPTGLERKKSAENVKLPCVVHCSAGIGRTGCFIAILNGIQQLRSNNNVDVLAILCSLRLNRGGMVQTAEQYELIHRVLSLYSQHM